MKKGVKRRIVSILLVLVITLSSFGVSFIKPERVESADTGNVIMDKLIEDAIDRAFEFVDYSISYGLNALADELDDQELSAVVSFMDMFLWDTDETNKLEQIVEMCEAMLEEIQLIENRQTEYGKAMLNKIESGAMLDAKQNLDSAIQHDINDQLNVADCPNLSQLINAYKTYLIACDNYKKNGTDYTNAKAAFDTALDNMLGTNSKTDVNRYATDIIGSRFNTVLYNLIDNLYVGADSSQANSDLTVTDMAARLAYLYYPWSYDQYSFVKYELDSQVNTIMIVALVYEEYLSRQYDYLNKHDLLDDENGIAAANYLNNKNNLYNDIKEFAKRYVDLTEKNLTLDAGVSIKLYQYYKPQDMYYSDTCYYHDSESDNNTPVYADLFNENYKAEMNYKDEEKGYLAEDFAEGGPLHGLDDDNHITKEKRKYDAYYS